MNQSRYGHEGIFGKRVVGFAGSDVEFTGKGDHRPSNRIVGILSVDERCVVRSDRNGQVSANRLNCRTLVRGKAKNTFQAG